MLVSRMKDGKIVNKRRALKVLVNLRQFRGTVTSLLSQSPLTRGKASSFATFPGGIKREHIKCFPPNNARKKRLSWKSKPYSNLLKRKFGCYEGPKDLPKKCCASKSARKDTQKDLQNHALKQKHTKTHYSI